MDSDVFQLTAVRRCLLHAPHPAVQSVAAAEQLVPPMLWPLKQHMPSRRRLAGSFFRTLAYCSVVLSLWQAPFPWFHCHSPGDDEQVTQLTHVAAYHAGGYRPGREQQRAWHLHFALLPDIVRGGGCPVPPDEDGRDRESLQNIPLASDSAGGSPRLLQAGNWLGGLPSFTSADLAAAPRLFDDRFLNRHPLNRSASSGGLLPLLCICVC